MADATKSTNAQRKSVYIRQNSESGAAPSQGVRKSVWRNQSTVSNARYSIHGHRMADASGPRVRTLQPTYRMEPKRPLNLECINRLLRRTADIAVASNALERFSMSQANRFCQSLAREIELRLRGEQFDRYRFVAIVTLVEKKNQCAMQQMGFVWDTTLDQWASYVNDNQWFTLSVCVMCVYWE